MEKLIFYVTPKIDPRLSESQLENGLRTYRLTRGAEYLCIDTTRGTQGDLQLLVVLDDGEIRYIPADKMRAVLPFKTHQAEPGESPAPSKPEKKKAATPKDDGPKDPKDDELI